MRKTPSLIPGPTTVKGKRKPGWGDTLGSGVTPGGAQGTLWGAGDQNWVSCLQGKHPPCSLHCHFIHMRQIFSGTEEPWQVAAT